MGDGGEGKVVEAEGNGHNDLRELGFVEIKKATTTLPSSRAAGASRTPGRCDRQYLPINSSRLLDVQSAKSVLGAETGGRQRLESREPQKTRNAG